MQDDVNKILINTDFVENALAINQSAREELLLINSLKFSIFKL